MGNTEEMAGGDIYTCAVSFGQGPIPGLQAGTGQDTFKELILYKLHISLMNLMH